MRNYRISPSLLAANCARLGEEAQQMVAAGATSLHLDVMDNHYVPNLTFGPLVCKSLRQYGITTDIDVHLMAKPVDALIIQFATAGATSITFHPEATDHIDRSLALIRQQGCKTGLAFNPTTSLNHLEYCLDKVDSILLMSVNPGFGGQTFLPATLKKITRARALLNDNARSIPLAVDGGVNIDTINAAATAGADTFIVGSALFSTPDYARAFQALQHALP